MLVYLWFCMFIYFSLYLHLYVCFCLVYVCIVCLWKSDKSLHIWQSWFFLRSISIHTWRSPISMSGWPVTWDCPALSQLPSPEPQNWMDCRAFNMVLGIKLGQSFYSLSPILILLVFTIFRWYSLRVSPIGMLDVVIANFSETIKWFSCMDSFISLYTWAYWKGLNPSCPCKWQ